jgi:hypothetical protein
MSISGIGFALYTASLAHNFADAHHLQHLARTVLVVGANLAAFGTLWILKFLVLNRLFAEIADAEVGVEADASYAGSDPVEAASSSDPSPKDPV